nr:MAG TPA: hypothetical protein [Caudoviricetes sp.]
MVSILTTVKVLTSLKNSVLKHFHQKILKTGKLSTCQIGK